MDKKKLCLAAVSCGVILISGLAVGTALAWLTDSVGPVKNTFTVGSVRLMLTETWNTDTNSDSSSDSWIGMLIPGTRLYKDPVVTVAQDSEDCWLFVKVTEQNWPNTKEADGITRKVAYSIAEGWEPLPDGDGVYFRQVASGETDRAFSILTDNAVTISPNLTEQELRDVGDMDLIFTAWAIQRSGVESAAEAWDQLNA